jgi:hypothetical protein
MKEMATSMGFEVVYMEIQILYSCLVKIAAVILKKRFQEECKRQLDLMDSIINRL